MIKNKIGIKTATSTFSIEPGKVKEFALALGDSNPAYETGEIKVSASFEVSKA
ncbi:hypothetical protein [Brevibacillus porteri]|uniref:hypothetical protein n=1 Tax=Brevibacillus porteri TaxID=2126350 RepID=UPI003D1AF9D1